MTGYGLFRLNDFAYAVALGRIRRIIEGVTLYLLPGLPRGVASVLVHEDAIVPVCSPLPPAAADHHQDGTTCYVLVDSCCGALALPAQPGGRIVAGHKGRLGAPTDGYAVWEIATFRIQDHSYRILDVDRLAMEIIQGVPYPLPDAGCARRLDEEKTAVGR
ncbi:MAG: hypothetical protein R6W66_12015 [Pelovirga sp.]